MAVCLLIFGEDFGICLFRRKYRTGYVTIMMTRKEENGRLEGRRSGKTVRKKHRWIPAITFPEGSRPLCNLMYFLLST
jgi:hypothetical protein